MSKTSIETIFVGNSLRNFTYLIDRGDRSYYCVDPFDAKGIVAKITELGGTLIGIINTHQHPDHTCGNNELIEKFDAPLYAHYQADYQRDFIGLRHGETLELGGENRIVFWDTPGHTMTHLSLVMEYQIRPWAILSGDTMFNAGVGHCKLGGHPETLFQTMDEIYGALADEIEVFPGHEYFSNNLRFSLHCEPSNEQTELFLKKVENIDWSSESFRTSMGDERKINPFLRLDSIDLRKNLNMINSTNKEVFLKLRTMRNDW